MDHYRQWIFVNKMSIHKKTRGIIYSQMNLTVLQKLQSHRILFSIDGKILPGGVAVCGNGLFVSN